MPITVEQTRLFAQLGLAPPAAVPVSQDAATQDAATQFALQSVLESAAVGAIDNTLAAAPQDQPANFTETVLDPATLTFLFRVLDVRTGAVISQEPIGAQLQLQEFAQLLARGSTPSGAQATGSIDIQV